MSSRTIKNVSASIKQRLLNHARAHNRPYNQLKQYYAIERFLYRLSCSDYRERFFLKGALMFEAWRKELRRPTRDIDFLAHTSNSLDHFRKITHELCCVKIDQPDGIFFDPDSLNIQRNQIESRYQGVRVEFMAHLGQDAIPMQMDVGFGNPIYPEPALLKYPTILDLPAPDLLGYTPESVIAEKLEALVSWGMQTSRMKDLFDIFSISQQFPFNSNSLTEAIRATSATYRPSPEIPSAFTSEFLSNPLVQSRWATFIRKTSQPELSLPNVVDHITHFLELAIDAAIKQQKWNATWEPGGPWNIGH